jgi:hypothetical protein
MHKLYQKPVTNAFPDVKVPEPRISKIIIFLVAILSKAYMFILFGFAKITLHGDDYLLDVFKRGLAAESRVLLAFRHPDGREPQLLTWFFLFRLRKLAARKKVKLARKPHAIFVYGYEVVRWGGSLARFFMPNLGAIPIHHTKLDSKGMARLYNTIHDGPYPLALAPEGQVSYSTDSIPHLEAGIVKIGFQAVEKLQESDGWDGGGCPPLEILPISIHFRYGKSGISAMKKLLRKTEKICGLKGSKLSLEERLRNCREYILAVNEKRYGIKSDAGVPFEERLEKTVNTALETAERMLGIIAPEIKSSEDFFVRLYKVRHDCWDRIYLPNEDNLKKLSPVKRNALDQKAGEAWHVARHQELADFAWYFKSPLPNEKSALHIKVEYVQNLWDFANRTMGGAISERINIKPAKVIIKAVSPINLSSMYMQYKEDRKGTIAKAVCDLEKAYLTCITEVNAAEKD